MLGKKAFLTVEAGFGFVKVPAHFCTCNTDCLCYEGQIAVLR